jgi:hypothetical protein
LQIPFPEPITIGNRNYWRRRTVRNWLATIAREGEPPARPDDEALLTSRAVRELCGGVSDMWIWRKRQRPTDTDQAAA